MSNSKTSTCTSVDSDALVLIVNSTGSGDPAVAERPFRMNKPNCVIGSGSKADWMLGDADLKPEHAEIVHLSCGAFVRTVEACADQLLVNGEPVEESWVHSGDRLVMGNIELQVDGIDQIQFGSCDKLESLIIRSSEPCNTTAATVEQADSGVTCINFVPVANVPAVEVATVAEVTVEIEEQQDEVENSASAEVAESDDNPWFLVDSLVEDVEKYVRDSSDADDQCTDESDSHESNASNESCELTSEVEPPVSPFDAEVSESMESTDEDLDSVEHHSTSDAEGCKSQEADDQDLEMKSIWADMSDADFEMTREEKEEAEASQETEPNEPVKEALFQIPRIDIEASDDNDNENCNDEPTAELTRIEESRYDDDLACVEPDTSSDNDNCDSECEQSSEADAERDASCEAEEPQSEFSPAKTAPTTGRQADHSNEQANWLNELYDSIIPDEQEETETSMSETIDHDQKESVEHESKPEHSSWLSNRPFDLSDLMKPGSDPESVSELPDANEKHAAELFDKFDSLGQDTDKDRDFVLQEPASKGHASIDADAVEAETMHDNELFDAFLPDVDSVDTCEPDDQLNEVAEPEPVKIAAASEPALSVAEVLEQMKQAGEVKMDFEDDPQPNQSVSTLPVEPVPAPATEPAPAAEEQPKDDVNDYMSQLMCRLRGGTPTPASATPVEKVPTPAAPAATAATAKRKSQREIDDLAPENPLNADEYVSRSTRPEKPGSLTALRQIANQSVNTAIQRSLQNKNQNSSTMYLAGSGFAFCLSVILFIMSAGWFDLAFVAACISSVACALSGYMFVSVNNGLEKLLEYRKQKSATETKSETETQTTSSEQPTG